MDGSEKITDCLENGDERAFCRRVNRGEHSSPLVRRLPAGPKEGRSY